MCKLLKSSLLGLKVSRKPSVALKVVRVLHGPAGVWLGQRSPTRRAVAWILAVAGPALLTLASVPLRSSLVLGGFLFSALLVVIAVAVIGGTRPALTAVVL